MKMFLFKKLFFLSLYLLICASCTQVHKGYKFEEDDKTDIEKLVDKKANITEIIDRLGSPSFINSPINDTICYIDANGKKVAFNRFFKPTYQFICIVFDEKKQAKELIKQSLTKIEKTKMKPYNLDFKKPL